MMASTANAVTWRVVGFCEKTYQACPGAPVQAAGACENCGQGIRYVVTLRSSAGRTMDVGRDCAETLVGGEELREMRRLEREWERAQYLASPEYAAIQARRAAEEAARVANAAVAEEQFAMALACYRAIEAGANVRRQYRTMAGLRVESLLRGETWYANGLDLGRANDSDDEDEARAWRVAYHAATVPASDYVGGVGDKLTIAAVYEACIPFETAYGTSYVQKFRADNGAVLVWFSKAGDFGPRTIGDRCVIACTVKGHEDDAYGRQTIVTRVKRAK